MRGSDRGAQGAVRCRVQAGGDSAPPHLTIAANEPSRKSARRGEPVVVVRKGDARITGGHERRRGRASRARRGGRRRDFLRVADVPVRVHAGRARRARLKTGARCRGAPLAAPSLDGGLKPSAKGRPKSVTVSLERSKRADRRRRISRGFRPTTTTRARPPPPRAARGGRRGRHGGGRARFSAVADARVARVARRRGDRGRRRRPLSSRRAPARGLRDGAVPPDAVDVRRVVPSPSSQKRARFSPTAASRRSAPPRTARSPPRSPAERVRDAPAVEPRRRRGSTLYAENAEDTPGCFPEEALWRAFRGGGPVRPEPAPAPRAASSASRRARAASARGDASGGPRSASGGAARPPRWRGRARSSGTSLRSAAAKGRPANRHRLRRGGGGGRARGAFRPWPKTAPTKPEERRWLRRPGPAAAAAAAAPRGLRAPLPVCRGGGEAARASGLRRVLLVAGAPKLAHWVGVVSADVAALVPATAIHVLAACAAGGGALLGAGWACSRLFALFYAHAFAALAVAHVVALFVGERARTGRSPRAFFGRSAGDGARRNNVRAGRDGRRRRRRRRVFGPRGSSPGSPSRRA